MNAMQIAGCLVAAFHLHHRTDASLSTVARSEINLRRLRSERLLLATSPLTPS